MPETENGGGICLIQNTDCRRTEHYNCRAFFPSPSDLPDYVVQAGRQRSEGRAMM